MYLPLNKIPPGKPVVLAKVTDPGLAARLRHIGLFENSEIIRLEEEVQFQPVRIRGTHGDAVIGGLMGARIVVHTDDGRKLPLMEMKPGETGHIQGLTVGCELNRTLEVLGFKRNDNIRMIRNLPPMEYITVIEKGGRVRLTEGMAAKIWGCIQGENRNIQFVSSRTGVRFHVEKILGGANAHQMLRTRGVTPSQVLVLEGVSPAQSISMSAHHPLIISSRAGLRLYLRPADGERILVRYISSKARSQATP